MAMSRKGFRIMKDKGAWQFTSEQIIAIKNKNIAAVTKFYTDNFKLLAGMARTFARNRYWLYRSNLYTYDDYIQQIYVDLPYYDYSSRSALWYSIVKGSFLRMSIGGVTTPYRKYIKSSVIVHYDALAADSNDPYYALDKAAHTADVFEVITQETDREKNDEAIIAFLKRTMKNPKEFNSMFCCLFTDIPQSEIRGNEYELYAKCKDGAC